MLTQEDLEVATLGLNEKPSPLHLSSAHDDGLGDFVPGAASHSLPGRYLARSATPGLALRTGRTARTHLL